MMGQGRMGGGMMGYGMMGHGGDFPDECEEMMGKYGYRQSSEALTSEDAVSRVQNYLDQTRNPNLKIGEIGNDENGDYLVEIITKDGSLVDKLEVNQLTGWIHSIYGE